MSINHATAYTSGAHAPVAQELDSGPLPLAGEIPQDLHGLFVRNSSNPKYPPKGRYHWFDGDGMVHGLWFEKGEVTYRNRWIQTAQLKAEDEKGEAIWGGLFAPPLLDHPLGAVKDTANTDLVWHGGKLLATWWLAGTPYQIAVPSLQTMGPETFGGNLQVPMASHPKVDPRSGDLVFFGYSMVRRPFYHYGVVSADGSSVHSTPIDLPTPHIPHDIAITENYSIIFDLPLGWDAKALREGRRSLGFDREKPGRIGVLPRFGTQDSLRWFDVDPCYVYHTITAFERGTEIYIWACRIEDPIPARADDTGRVARLDTVHLQPHLYLWRIDLRSGEVKGEVQDDRHTEFPRIHDAYWTHPTRYSYNPRIAPCSDLSFDAFIKYDLTTGTSETCAYEEGWLGGEVLFAPRPGGSGEDDGWVLSILTHVGGQGSKLQIVDAKQVGAGALAEVTLPQAIPLGFHGAWVPGEEVR
jgi:carotenoid cleavage dioxygenase-like enzyme